MAISFPNPRQILQGRLTARQRRRSRLNSREQMMSAVAERSARRTGASGGSPRYQPTGPLPQRQLSQRLRMRLLLVWAILMLAMLLLAANLLRIQVFEAPMLRERAKGQQMIYINSTIPRRPIIDRVGNVLAIDKPIYTLYAHPVMFQESKETVALALAPILKEPPEAVLTRLNQGDTGVRVKDGLSEEDNHRVAELAYDGLELVPEQQRLYPQQELFSNVVGYVNVDRKGQAGVELSQVRQLEQHIKEMQLNRSGDGSIIPVGLPSDFLKLQKDDLRLQLTVDSRLQRASRSVLKQQMKKYSAKRGTVIVMDVKDGSILTMVSEPSFDPNKYYQSDLDRLRDWVLSDLYEPGSTFKPINLGIALEAGAIQPTDTVVDDGRIQIGEWPIQNSDYESMGGRGTISITEVLEYSSNVGMVRIMQRLQPGVYYGWLDRVGLPKPTGIDLPSEVAPQLKSYDQFTSALIEPATTAFGQGFSLTPIKLLQLHSILANKGKMVVPHVVRGLSTPHGELKWQPPLPPPRQIFSPETAQTVLEMMEQVVVQGTGKVARIPGYRIAGKTGTAQKAAAGGYSNARITSFIGMLPVNEPRYAVLAVVDEPQGDDAYGSTVAAPVVRSVMETLIALEQIPPTEAIDEDLMSELKPGTSSEDSSSEPTPEEPIEELLRVW